MLVLIVPDPSSCLFFTFKTQTRGTPRSNLSPKWKQQIETNYQLEVKRPSNTKHAAESLKFLISAAKCMLAFSN